MRPQHITTLGLAAYLCLSCIAFWGCDSGTDHKAESEPEVSDGATANDGGSDATQMDMGVHADSAPDASTLADQDLAGPEVDAAKTDADTEEPDDGEDAADPWADLVIEPGCNGDEALCAKRYDEVVYATTHNAMSSYDRDWLEANHLLGLEQQLRDGVRGLMIDVHEANGLVQVCHATCALGSRPFVDEMATIAGFLEAQPGAVITIIFEMYVDAGTVQAQMIEAGVAEFMYAHKIGEPWPTLQALVDANTRLVVLTDRDGGAFEGYHHVWDFAVETPFSARSKDDLRCTPNRGTLGNDLFIFNHFLTDDFPSEDLSQTINYDPFLTERIEACEEAFGQPVNFVTVDFYSRSDLRTVVANLNAR